MGKINVANNSNKSMVILCYAIVYIVWGSTYFFIEKALDHGSGGFAPFVLGSLRFISAGLLLMLYCKMKGYTLFKWKAVKEALFVGFLLLFVDMAAIIWAEQHISSGIVSIISAACAIWFVLLDKPRWKENFSSITTVAGVILGFCGVFMLFAEQAFTKSDKDNSMQLIAMAVMVIGTIGWTIGSLASKYFSNKSSEIDEEKSTDDPLEKEDLHIMVKTAWQMLTASFAFTIIAIFNGEYAAFDASTISIEKWLSLIYLAIFGSIIAFSAYLWLLQVRPATEVSTYAYINPIVAMILVYFFTDHEVTRLQIWGLVVVLCSVLMMNWNMYKDTKAIAVITNRRYRKYVVQKSSIPRIIELVEILRLREHKK